MTPPTPQPDVDGRDVAPRRVVVADDADDLRMLLTVQLDLDPRFVVVGTAADGAELLAVAEREHPDALLVDLEMPGALGEDVVRRLRRVVPAAVILVLSGHLAMDREASTLAAGADRYMQKGGDMTRLRDVLAHLMEAR